MTDYDAILTAARPPEHVERVCTRGDLVAEYTRLDRELAQARLFAAADPRAAGTGAPDVADRLAELRAQIEQATVPFRLRALPPKRWVELCEQHPPRRQPDGSVHPYDAGPGVNNDTFFPALIRESTVEPVLRDETWAALLDRAGTLLNQEQVLRLGRACWDLNKQTPDLPFSSADWLSRRISDSGSDSPEPSASASDGSTGGSPSGPPATSTTTPAD